MILLASFFLLGFFCTEGVSNPVSNPSPLCELWTGSNFKRLGYAIRDTSLIQKHSVSYGNQMSFISNHMVYKKMTLRNGTNRYLKKLIVKLSVYYIPVNLYSDSSHVPQRLQYLHQSDLTLVHQQLLSIASNRSMDLD